VLALALALDLFSPLVWMISFLAAAGFPARSFFPICMHARPGYFPLKYTWISCINLFHFHVYA
jgi:hypothetical protein